MELTATRSDEDHWLRCLERGIWKIHEGGQIHQELFCHDGSMELRKDNSRARHTARTSLPYCSIFPRISAWLLGDVGHWIFVLLQLGSPQRSPSSACLLHQLAQREPLQRRCSLHMCRRSWESRYPIKRGKSLNLSENHTQRNRRRKRIVFPPKPGQELPPGQIR